MLIQTPERRELSNNLTPTETDILRLIAKGMTVKEIASERISSIHTIVTQKKTYSGNLESTMCMKLPNMP